MRARGGGCEFGAIVVPVVIPVVLSHSVALRRRLLAPVIHPTSSGSQGWAQVLGRSPSLGASPSFVIVVPPLAVVLAAVPPLLPFPPRRHSPLAIVPPSPSFPLRRRSHACRGCPHPLLLLVPSSPSLSSHSVIIRSWSLLSPSLAPAIPHMSSCSPWRGRVLGWRRRSLLVPQRRRLVLVIVLVAIVLSLSLSLSLLSCHRCPVVVALSLSSSSYPWFIVIHPASRGSQRRYRAG